MSRYFIKFHISYRPKSFITETIYSECKGKCECVIDLSEEETHSIFSIKQALEQRADIIYKRIEGIIYQRITEIISIEKL